LWREADSLRASIDQARNPMPHAGLVQYAGGFGIVSMAPVGVLNDSSGHIRLSLEAERIFERQ
jgi:hypothetical protein